MTIDDDRGGGDVAVRSAGDGERQVGIAGDFDGVAGVGCAHEHLQLHVDFFFAAGEPRAIWCTPATWPAATSRNDVLHAFARNHRLDRFRNFIHVKAQRVGNHRHGFRQAVMLDRARRDLRAKFLDAHSRAHFFLQRQAALGCIHDAHGARGFDGLRQRRSV